MRRRDPRRWSGRLLSPIKSDGPSSRQTSATCLECTFFERGCTSFRASMAFSWRLSSLAALLSTSRCLNTYRRGKAALAVSLACSCVAPGTTQSRNKSELDGGIARFVSVVLFTRPDATRSET